MDSHHIKTTPKDFFMNISAVAALYVSVISLINLLFAVIDRAFPDALQTFYYEPYSSGLRIAIASLIIVFPLYIILARLINKDIEVTPEKAELAPRKWLTYLTLFLAGIAIAIDLIALVNVFLGGELTTRFTLKVVALLIVTGMVFAYYLTELRKGAIMTLHTRRMWRFGAITLVVISLIIGFVVLGSPAQARKLRFDEMKSNDLQNIQWQVINFWQQKQRLPQSLQEVSDPLSGFTIPLDRQFNKSYEYRMIGNTTFELCADFNLSSRSEIADRPSMQRPLFVGEPQLEVWKHNSGRTCFERTVDPERYPPFTKGIR
jgi:hypothetical protein